MYAKICAMVSDGAQTHRLCVPSLIEAVLKGAYCTTPSPNTIHLCWDNTTKRHRRRAAGCEPRPNRCSTKKNYPLAGYQCDEYPFASTTVQQGFNHRVNRCVPGAEIARQGGIISRFYSLVCRSQPPCDFDIGFTNAGNLLYCQGSIPLRPVDLAQSSR
jgi:deoxyribonuclease NucA/NucB